MTRALAALALLAACSPDPRVAVTVQASFVADPASHDFGAIQVGGSDVKTIVVSTLDEDILIVETSECTDFSISLPDGPVAVSPESPFALEVTFAPTFAGSFACDVTFYGNEGNQVVSFIGLGTVPGPVATLVAPAGGAIAFGQVPVNVTSAAQTIEVRNDGTSTLTILSAGFQPGGGDDLAVVATGSDAVEPGLSQTWDVTCTRLANGDTAGTYEITHDDPSGAPILIDITCTGVTTIVYVQPAPAVFGEVLTGGSLDLDLAVHNDNSAAETIASVDLTASGPGFTHDLGVGEILPAGGSLPLRVTFTPEGDGEVTGTLTITTQSSESFALGLGGTGVTAIISVTPPDPEIDLGTACVGGATERVPMGIRNVGTGAFFLDGVNLDPQYPFTGQSFDTAPASIPPGTFEWSMEVWFEPTEPGERLGALQINTDIPGDTAHRVPLRGRGLEAVVGATHVAQAFGAVDVGELSGAEELGVINCTSSSVTVSAAIEGADAGAFQILPGDPTTGVGVAMGETSTWSVLFEPAREGAHEASLVITWADGSVEIPLTGLGVDDLIPGGEDDDPRGTYLACSSGDPGSLALVLLALLALRRRVE